MDRRWKRVALIALLALIGSNCWWLYALLDEAVTQKYQGQIVYERTEALKQLSRITLHVSRSTTRAELEVVLKKQMPHDTPFDKDGATWAGFLGFKFDDKGYLAQVVVSPLQDG